MTNKSCVVFVINSIRLGGAERALVNILGQTHLQEGLDVFKNPRAYNTGGRVKLESGTTIKPMGKPEQTEENTIIPITKIICTFLKFFK